MAAERVAADGGGVDGELRMRCCPLSVVRSPIDAERTTGNGRPGAAGRGGTVCEVRSARAEKRGGRNALPSRRLAGAYCMPPAALLYEKVLPEPLVEFDVPVNDGFVPAAPVMAMLTVPDCWNPGSVAQGCEQLRYAWLVAK